MNKSSITSINPPPELLMTHRLIQILPGHQLDRFINNATAAMQEDPFSTLLILPTSHLVREVRRRLLDQGISFIQTAVTTIDGYAESVVDTHAGGMIQITSHEKELIINTLLQTGDYPLLAPKRHPGSGIAKELRILFDVLQEKKIEYPMALQALQSRKSDEIGSIYSAYSRYLRERLLLDGQTTIEWVTDRIQKNGGPQSVFIYGLYEPIAIEKELILALKRTAECFQYAIPFIPESKCFGDDGSWLRIETRERAADTLPSLARFFDDQNPTTIRITAYRDPLDELRGIAGEIHNLIDEGTAPGDICLVFPAIADAVHLTEEVFGEYGIPYSTSTRRSITSSPIIRSLLLVLSVPVLGYQREDLLALLRSPYFSYTWNQNGDTIGLDGGKVDQLSRRAGVTGEKNDWRDRITRFINVREADSATLSEEKARYRREEIEEYSTIHSGIESLFTSLDTLTSDQTLTDHLRNYRSLLTTLKLPVIQKSGGREMIEDEDRALIAFTRILDRLELSARIIPENKITAGTFLSLLKAVGSQTRIPTERNRHAVQVLGIREITHLRTPHLFIAHLTEGTIPNLSTRLPLCTNLETKMLGTRTGPEILREERYYFLAALVSAEETISLSYPKTDGEKVLLRSGFLRDLPEQENEQSSYKNSRFARAEAAGNLLAEGDHTGAYSLFPDDLESVAHRITIEEYHRNGPPSSAYDGVLKDDEAIITSLHKRFGDEAIYSASSLERYANCPFAFFVRNVLSLEPLPEIDLDLTNLERGNLIHRIAYRFFRERGDRIIREETLQEAITEIRSICSEELNLYARSNPVWTVEAERLLGSDEIGTGVLEEFLRYEMKLNTSPFIPAHFECSFGLPLTGEADPGSIRDPVTIPLDDEASIRLSGRIDRIDTTEDRRFCVIDYKTGTSPGYKEIIKGRALQLPLYIRAAELGMGLIGAGGAYYTLKKGDVKCQAIIRDESVEDYFKTFSRSTGGGDRPLTEVISESLRWVRRYLDGIRDGQFQTVADEKNCSEYCNYKTVCRFNRQRLFEEVTE